MRTADIKVGVDYAYIQYKYATPMRATVLATGERQTIGTYAWERRSIKSGVRITLHTRDGDVEKVVESRQIARTWAEQETRNAEAKAARESREAWRVESLRMHAENAKVLHDALTRLGVPAEPRRLWRSLVKVGDVDILRSVGFRVQGHKERFVVSPVRNLDDLLHAGSEVDVRDALVLAEAVLAASADVAPGLGYPLNPDDLHDAVLADD